MVHRFQFNTHYTTTHLRRNSRIQTLFSRHRPTSVCNTCFLRLRTYVLVALRLTCEQTLPVRSSAYAVPSVPLADLAPLRASPQTDYIKSMGLAGSMVWSVETDDFRGLCGFGTKNPLMNAIWTNLNGEIPTPVPQPTTPAPTGPVSFNTATLIPPPRSPPDW